ncbi:MAG: hypothetical protein B9S33_02380 [Pedosphaera sp. Tous-C6FEB]|nr:MAG: hypothetical protein B9S33_02380 [Pedosphaera sp. Tous-C6FEB]
MARAIVGVSVPAGINLASAPKAAASLPGSLAEAMMAALRVAASLPDTSNGSTLLANADRLAPSGASGSPASSCASAPGLPWAKLHTASAGWMPTSAANAACRAASGPSPPARASNAGWLRLRSSGFCVTSSLESSASTTA